MSNIVQYNDQVAIHPGYYVLDVIDNLGISQSEFALRLNTTPKTISKLVNAQINLSNDLAKKLSVMLGTSIDLWLNLQTRYDKKIIEIECQKDFDEQVEIVKLIDYNYFVKVAGLVYTKNTREKIENLCKFLKIADLRILKDNDFLVNFRSAISKTNDKNLINSRAWIQTAINLSKDIEVNKFDIKKLNSYLNEIRSMTTQSEETFIPRLKEIFNECGVVFIMLPHLKNSGVNGAVKWLNQDKVLLAMNNREQDIDKFWFSLFYEIKHVQQQKIKTTFVNSTTEKMDELNMELEKEADLFARNYLIKEDDLINLIIDEYISEDKIISLAKEIGIHPGIVVGRLQHDKIIPMNRFNNLKEKYHLTLN